MHIPDGFLDIRTVVLTDTLSGVLLLTGIKKVQKKVTPQSVARMGIATAFIFAVNTIAFPVPGGTSAHLTGVVLVSSLTGAWMGFISSACALFLQAVLFQHGGILSLGANILNISGWGALLGSIPGRLRKFSAASGGFLAFLAVMAGSISCAFELSFPGRGSFFRGAAAMGIANFFPAVIDGVMTFFVLKLAKKKELRVEAQSD